MLKISPFFTQTERQPVTKRAGDNPFTQCATLAQQRWREIASFKKV